MQDHLDNTKMVCNRHTELPSVHIPSFVYIVVLFPSIVNSFSYGMSLIARSWKEQDFPNGEVPFIHCLQKPDCLTLVIPDK